MTFVGKILVIVIMAFALLFLGVSTVVFTTEKNWKQATADTKKKLDDLTRKNAATVTENEAAKKDLEAVRKDLEAAKQAHNDRLNTIDAQIKAAEAENAQSKTLPDAGAAKRADRTSRKPTR